ncbi:MAG TPA: YceI family protein [Gammaproteobacteria bacterium]|nr:YceI family protein [Gammaproteobacteria bacterium]
MRRLMIAFAALAFALPLQAAPETFTIDKGHTFINFKVSHIGFSWLPGRFTDFDGTLVYDEANPANSKVEFTVNMPSLNTDHAERDKHLRSSDFLEADKYRTAKFVSTAYEKKSENDITLRGNLTIKGKTQPVEFKVVEMAAAKDPWGNFRRGWSAKTSIALADFGIDDFGGVVKNADIEIFLEATKK